MRAPCLHLWRSLSVCQRTHYAQHNLPLLSARSVHSLGVSPPSAFSFRSLRYVCEVQYQGGQFTGWQKETDQHNAIANHLDKALRPLVNHQLNDASTQKQNEHGFIGPLLHIVGSGRTDAGVHATAQVCHIDLFRLNKSSTRHAEILSPAALQAILNNHFVRNSLSIHVTNCFLVDPDLFHARHSAQQRHYKYRLVTGTDLLTERGRAFYFPSLLNCSLMRQTAEKLTGKHNFESFRKKGCTASSAVRTIDRIEIHELSYNSNNPSSLPGQLIEITVSARSFLYQQVRNLVSVMVAVGSGQLEPQRVERLLEGRPRELNPIPPVPAHGLYLTGIQYDSDLLQRAKKPFEQFSNELYVQKHRHKKHYSLEEKMKNSGEK